MRLICPNCSAQYEIDGSLIPDEGRDVQCSNCGQTWFELPPPPQDLSEMASEPSTEHAAEDAEHEADVAEREAEVAEHEAEVAEQEVVAAADAPMESDDVSVAEQAAEETDAEAGDEPDAPASVDESEDEDWNWPKTRMVAPQPEMPPQVAKPTPAPPQRQTVDEDARAILRQEAEHEIAQRRTPPAGPLETQSDLGLSSTSERDSPSRALRARMARLRGDDDETGETLAQDAYSPPRRDLLPDIEEINSSLRPAHGGAQAGSTISDVEHRKGFRTGFAAMVLLAVVLILAYTQAPRIASAFPAAEGVLIAYVDWANDARDRLNELLANVSTADG
jgi:predicted Zn finger-like uncharacterized protein